jgi:signal transduction histidine kinase
MNQNSLDLSRIRHDLRTPINQILGYCEMLMEDPDIPAAFQPDLERIREGGRQLLALIGAYFNEATFADKRRDLHQLCHDLRTPVNHIVGYSEMLQEQAEESGQTRFAPDLQKIHSAAMNWLALMEEYLIPPETMALSDSRESIDAARVLAGPILQPGFICRPLLPAPSPRNGNSILAPSWAAIPLATIGWTPIILPFICSMSAGTAWVPLCFRYPC